MNIEELTLTSHKFLQWFRWNKIILFLNYTMNMKFKIQKANISIARPD